MAFYKKYIAGGLVIILVSSNISTLKIFAEPSENISEISYSSSNEEIFIEDINLENEVRKALRIYDRELTEEDMKKLTTLSCSEKKIKSLSGLEYAVNLQGLVLDNNEIKDITPLKDLVNLSYLHISNNNISDISNLANLTNLNTLGISNNNITNIDIVRNLKSLDFISMSQNKIGDIRPLSELTNLKTLYASACEISSIDALKDLNLLEVVDLSNNQISDITPLNADNTIELILNNNNIEDIGTLSNSTNLRSIILSDNRIRSIENLKDMQNIENVELSNNNITYLGDLSSLTNLKSIHLDGNNISNISNMKLPTSLENINLSQNNLENIEGFANNTQGNLININMNNNNISDLNPLSNLKRLKFLYLGTNKISDLSPLSNLSRLQTLDVSENCIKDLRPLSGLLRLTQNGGLSAYSQNVDLEEITLDNGSSYTFKVDDIYDIEGNKVDINSISILDINTGINDGYFNDSSITIDHVVKDLRVSGEFFVNSSSFNGSINQNINVSSKPIEEVIDFNGIEIEDNNPIINDSLNIGVDISGKESEISSIELYYNGSRESEYRTVTLSEKNNGKLVGTVYAYELGNWNLNFIKIRLENGQEYKITRDSNEKLSEGDFIVKDGKKEINISDENLEFAIKKQLGLQYSSKPITEADIRNLKSLEVNVSFGNEGVTSLEGLDQAYNLEYLKISNNGSDNISNLGVIGKLSKLKNLSINQSNLNDLSFLSNLSNLETLEILGDGNIDINYLANCSNLKSLSITKTNIENIGTLQDKKLLSDVNVNNIKNLNLNDISKLNQVTSLGITESNLENISPLKNMTNLMNINLSNNNIEDISSIKNMSKLESLLLGSNKISNIDVVSNLKNLNTLNIYNNKVSNIPIELLDLDNLRYIYAQEQRITNEVIDSNTSTISIENPVSLFGEKITEFDNNLDFVVNEGNLEWSNVTISTDLYARFGKYINNDRMQLSFTGLVTQPVEYNNAPTIIANNIELQLGESFDAKNNVSANDYEDGNLTKDIEIIENTVNNKKPGAYKVTYKVTDKKGLSTTKTITVKVKSEFINFTVNNINSKDKVISGRGLSGATVEVFMHGEKIGKATVDSSGKYKIDLHNTYIDSGYKVTVTMSKDGYTTKSKSINVIGLAVASVKSLTNDIYRYDAGKGKYLTYINGKGYSQYSYLNKSGKYAFTPSSWMVAAGLTVSMPTALNGNTMIIDNDYIGLYNDAQVILNKLKSKEISPNEAKIALSSLDNKFNDLGKSSLSDFSRSSVTKILTNDIYRYDAGSGSYLTYINGKGYSQYSYLNKSGKYAFTPSSWMVAAGLTVTMPTSSNGYTMKIDNPYITKYNDVVKQIESYI